MAKFFIILSAIMLIMLVFTIWAFTSASQLRPVCVHQETWAYNPSTGQCYISPSTCLPRNYRALDNATGCNCDNLHVLDEAQKEFIRNRCLDDNMRP
ncbi:MAG: hypothetical protein HY513_04220 [Candidatus Aenigmarchaeota archaeon]|nr:hypothetical protein [Candidatus Aenigmarchaeota archaeon]